MVMLAEREEVDALFDRVLSGREVTSVYQPLVHLGSGEVAGFEALARGPEGPLHSGCVVRRSGERRAGRGAGLGVPGGRDPGGARLGSTRRSPGSSTSNQPPCRHPAPTTWLR